MKVVIQANRRRSQVEQNSEEGPEGELRFLSWESIGGGVVSSKLMTALKTDGPGGHELMVWQSLRTSILCPPKGQWYLYFTSLKRTTPNVSGGVWVAGGYHHLLVSWFDSRWHRLALPPSKPFRLARMATRLMNSAARRALARSFQTRNASTLNVGKSSRFKTLL